MPFGAVVAIVCLVIGLPWLILHYVTKWKQAPKMTPEDETLLDDMFNLARRLEDRVNTVERIIAADHPDFKSGLSDYRAPSDYRLEGRSDRRN